MQPNLPSIVAILATIINSIQLFPQLYKTYTTKSVGDLSFYSLLLLLTTNFLWLLHGYFVKSYSLIIASIIGLIVNVSLLMLYFTYKK
jgi:MtN3 and saliva related transmembrane protein